MKRYNKSEIMRRAHHIRNHSFVAISMSESLKQAWREAKRAMKQREESGKYFSSIECTAADERNARLYKNVTFGKNDWAVSYGRKYRYF